MLLQIRRHRIPSKPRSTCEVSLGLGTILGAGIGGLIGLKGSRDRNQAQKEAAATQMAFQREMSSTGYQRAMADMRAAGLNPILAGKYGPASTPGGAMPLIENEMVGLSQGVNSALSTAVQSRQVENIAASTVKTLGETSIGNRILNEVGGAQAVTKAIKEDPELAALVEVAQEKLEATAFAKLIKQLIGSDQTGASKAKPGAGTIELEGKSVPLWENPHPPKAILDEIR